MNRRKRVVNIVIMAALFTLLFCMVVYAADGVGQGSDATVDILQGDRFSGAVEWVNKIGKFVDNWFMAFISFISFFIISASCLRNVLAGAYCVFPKFWDKVYEAHQQGQQLTIASMQSYFTGGGWKNTSTGSITTFLLRILPNIKVLTDFENAQDVDYKQYFMRAIPQCVLAVFVGVFIYNGYYRDVMIVTSQFGSRLTLNALTSISPDDILYKLSNISGIPDYPIKNATSGTDYIANQYLTAVVKSINGDFPDQAEKKNKEKLYNALSDWASNHFATEFAEYQDTEVWSVSISDAGRKSTKTESKSDGLSADGMVYRKQVYVSSSELLSLGMNTEYNKGEEIYYWANVIMTNQGAKGSAADVTVNDFVLTLPATIVGKAVNFETSSGYGTIKSDAGGNNITIDGIKVTPSKKALLFEKEFTPTKDKAYAATGLRYTSDSKTFTIASVIFKDGVTTATLTSSSTGIAINVGDSVVDAWNAKKHSNGGGTGTTQSPDDEDDEGGSDLEDPDDE